MNSMSHVPTSELPIVHRGSVKIIRRAAPKVLAFEHTDQFSVFDCGPHPQEIPGMGKALCECNVASFKLAKALSISTHFLGQKDERTILVREFGTPKDRALRPDETDVMIPLEFIDRSHVSGSLRRAFLSQKKRPKDYGFLSDQPDNVPREGAPIPFPVHEVSTKWEKVDRSLTVGEALRLSGMSVTEWNQAWSLIDRLDGALSFAAHFAGFTRLDGKKELAFWGPNREIILIDAFGNPHEDRYADTLLLRDGRVEHYSKEFLRQLFIENGFFEKVQQARTSGQKDPEYPLLSGGEIEIAAWRFKTLAERYSKAVAQVVG